MLVGGRFSPNLSFSSSTLSALHPPDPDWFVAKYNNVACNCNLLQPEFSYTSSPGGQSYNLNYNGDKPYTSISWSFGDGATASGIANPYHLYTSIGNYPICVTVTNGCGSNSICHWVNISTTGINDISSGKSIYPNPGAEQINIARAKPGMILDIYDVQGQKLGRYKLQGTEDKISINSLTPGVYLLVFTDKDGSRHMARLIKR